MSTILSRYQKFVAKFFDTVPITYWVKSILALINHRRDTANFIVSFTRVGRESSWRRSQVKCADQSRTLERLTSRRKGLRLQMAGRIWWTRDKGARAQISELLSARATLQTEMSARRSKAPASALIEWHCSTFPAVVPEKALFPRKWETTEFHLALTTLLPGAKL